MSNISGDEGSFSSGNNGEDVYDESKQQQVQNNLNDTDSGLIEHDSTCTLVYT
jgi:hypothetical protein